MDAQPPSASDGNKSRSAIHGAWMCDVSLGRQASEAPWGLLSFTSCLAVPGKTCPNSAHPRVSCVLRRLPPSQAVLNSQGRRTLGLPLGKHGCRPGFASHQFSLCCCDAAFQAMGRDDTGSPLACSSILLLAATGHHHEQDTSFVSETRLFFEFLGFFVILLF